MTGRIAREFLPAISWLRNTSIVDRGLSSLASSYVRIGSSKENAYFPHDIGLWPVAQCSAFRMLVCLRVGAFCFVSMPRYLCVFLFWCVCFGVYVCMCGQTVKHKRNGLGVVVWWCMVL